jgi:hypothetical protein
VYLKIALLDTCILLNTYFIEKNFKYRERCSVLWRRMVRSLKSSTSNTTCTSIDYIIPQNGLVRKTSCFVVGIFGISGFQISVQFNLWFYRYPSLSPSIFLSWYFKIIHDGFLQYPTNSLFIDDRGIWCYIISINEIVVVKIAKFPSYLVPQKLFKWEYEYCMLICIRCIATK